MNAKAKGTRLERKTAELLEALGYDVTRAAGSHGLWDLIATHRTHVRYIQVKANRKPGTVEREAMLMFECPATASREIWVWRDRARLPSVEIL